MHHRTALVILDCGATSVRALAVDPTGKVLAKASRPNATVPDDENPAWHVWPLGRIVDDLAECSREVMQQIAGVTVRGVGITSFGVDGALVDASLAPVYPVISWKCPRTLSVMEAVEASFAVPLAQMSGVGRFSFNTIYKLAWLKKHKPDIFASAQHWLFMPALIAAQLCGEAFTDRTMAGTSSLCNPATGAWHPAILERLGVSDKLFPPLREAGTLVGILRPEAAGKFALPPGTSLYSCGHDTQFALLGSGAAEGEAVLSSGTWEILMARSRRVDLSRLAAGAGATCELDAREGFLNPGVQWLASAILEWVKNLHFPGCGYDTLLAEARAVPPGAQGIAFGRDFFLSGGTKGGTITGLSHSSTRGEIYRAALESLAFLLKEQLLSLESITGTQFKKLIMVGGGTRNELWNQIKADVLGRDIEVVAEPETTVIGAACAVYKGLGYHPGLDAARAAFTIETRVVHPGIDSHLYASSRRDHE